MKAGKKKTIVRKCADGHLVGVVVASQMLNVSRGHLSRVLRGERESKSIRRRMRQLGIVVRGVKK